MRGRIAGGAAQKQAEAPGAATCRAVADAVSGGRRDMQGAAHLHDGVDMLVPYGLRVARAGVSDGRARTGIHTGVDAWRSGTGWGLGWPTARAA